MLTLSFHGSTFDFIFSILKGVPDSYESILLVLVNFKSLVPVINIVHKLESYLFDCAETWHFPLLFGLGFLLYFFYGVYFALTFT